MAYFLSPVLNEQQFDANGDPLAGGQIETYLAGTLTSVFTYKTESGTAHSNPIILDAAGYYPTGTQLWLDGGAVYKFIVKDSLGATLRTIDNITGINDSNFSPSEWTPYTLTGFSYLSPTSFSVVGDQTNIFQVNRRVQTVNTGGFEYGTIVSSVYGAPNTVVTVVNTSGNLDSGLSAVFYGLLSAQNDSIPLLQTANIADDAITTAKILDGNVTPAKLSQKPTLGTSQALTSGTSKTFPINSWAKEIKVAISGLSTSGTSQQLLRARVSGSAVVAGYLGSTSQLSTAVTSSLTPASGFALVETTVAAATYHGTLTMTLVDAATNRWSYSSSLSRSDVAASNVTNGSITLSGPLDGVILTTLGGVDTFDAGLANTLEIG